MDDNLDVVVDFFERRNVEKKYIQRLKEEKVSIVVQGQCRNQFIPYFNINGRPWKYSNNQT